MRGGKRKGAGRPAGSKIKNPRDIVKQIRWTASEWERVEMLADAESLAASVFIRRKALK